MTGSAKREVLVFVLANNANGECELVNYRMTVSQADYESGNHYLTAVHLSREQGFENACAFDQFDPAGRLLAGLMKTKATLLDIALTPKEGEPCDSAKGGRQAWVDADHVYGKLTSIIDSARANLGAKTIGQAEEMKQEARESERTGLDYEMSAFGSLDGPRESPRG